MYSQFRDGTLGSVLSVASLKGLVLALDPSSLPFWQSLGLASLTALAFWALASFPMAGALAQRKWAEQCKGGGQDYRQNHLPAALGVVAMGIAALTVYLGATAFHVDKSFSVWILLVNIATFGLIQVLRGFAQPLLFKALDVHAEGKYKDLLNSIRSRGSGKARLVQFVTAMMSVAVALLLLNQSAGDPVRNTVTVSASMMVLFLLFIGQQYDHASITKALSRRGITRLLQRLPGIPRDILSVLVDRGMFPRLLFLGFAASLLVSNVFGDHRINLNANLEFNEGSVFYALAFLFVDICIETRGRQDGLRLYGVGIGANLAGIITCLIGREIGSARLFDGHLWVFGASMISFTVAQFLDVQIFARLREMSGHRGLWSRVIISGFVSQAIDTLIFVSVASWPLGLPVTYRYITGQMLAKMFVIMVLTVPLAYFLRWFHNHTITDASTGSELRKI